MAHQLRGFVRQDDTFASPARLGHVPPHGPLLIVVNHVRLVDLAAFVVADLFSNSGPVVKASLFENSGDALVPAPMGRFAAAQAGAVADVSATD